MAAARRKAQRKRPTKRKGPWSEISHAVESCDATPPQYRLLIEIVVRNDSNLQEADRALDDIRCYGSAQVVEVSALEAGDPLRLPDSR